MAEDVKYINKIDVGLPDESGNYSISLWVTGADDPDAEVFMTDTFNVSGSPPGDVIDTILSDNGFNPL